MAKQLKTIGKYEIVDLIGEGAMGKVYRGFDPFSERYVAIKIANPSQLDDEQYGRQYRKLFFNEAHAAGLLDHPNIVKTIDANIEGGHSYIVMEYIHGSGTLEHYIRRPNLLPSAEIVRFLYKTAKALDFAHQHGVIHRDIKPSNIILTDERDVKLADFGVALVNRADTHTTQVMGMVGSPLYMSPEQIKGHEVGARADIFSLGVVAYQLLTGVHPFYADSLNTVIQRIVKDEVSPVSNYREECPESLDRLVLRMMQKSPEERFSRMLDVAVELAFVYEEVIHHGGADNAAALRAIREVPLFRDFSDQDIRELARASVIESKDAGEVIIREREEDHAFFVLLEGVVQVSKDDQPIDDLGAGQCFGEMGFLSRTSRTATVAAKTTVRLLRVNKEIIDSVPESTQVKFYQTFVDVLIKRLGVTTEHYLQSIKI